ncbi:MAG: hypothetical protein JW842_04305 [Prolixibacteraceae bacterium]|nr:hypothetical protein [Prolixibacteraceae bacterium]
MKNLITFVLFLVITGAGHIHAQQIVTVNAVNYDISDNLNLESVAYIFGESKDLADFERKINDPELQISNLDLNNDGYIDYLRVVEAHQGNVSVVTIQSVLGLDIYQDVATIDIEVKNKRKVYVQVVGNEFIYGHNYIIEPIYVRRPVIYSYLWSPRRVVWVSPYYWGYYPRYYTYHRPRPVHVYHHYVYSNYHPRIRYHHVRVRKMCKAHTLQAKVHRNDYAKTRPDYSFEKRNKGIENHSELNSRRSTRPNTGVRSSNQQKSVYSGAEKSVNNRRSITTRSQVSKQSSATKSATINKYSRPEASNKSTSVQPKSTRSSSSSQVRSSRRAERQSVESPRRSATSQRSSKQNDSNNSRRR